MDIILAILPWKLMRNVAINKREKLGAMVAMSMGVLYSPLPRFFPAVADWFFCGAAVEASAGW